jgi:hypothetical protein
MHFLKIILISLLFLSSNTKLAANNIIGSKDYVLALQKATNIMVNDVASPVAASRYYAYITIAAYEIYHIVNQKEYAGYQTVLHEFPTIIIADSLIKKADKNLASILMAYRCAETLLPSGYLIKKEIDSIKNNFTNKGEQFTFNITLELVNNYLNNYLPYVRKDGFAKLNNLPRYTPKKGPGFWQPTAPAFMQGLEPHWNKLRTFVIDSAQSFKVIPPALYDTSKQSSFYQQMQEVYDVVNKKNKEQIAIASFWDCNPFHVTQIGHVEFGTKKISPGGHWIGITGIVTLQNNLSLAKTLEIHSLVGIALADAFIACWDEKYRSQRVRPESAIQKLINPRWAPLLQTPPFPEYVSGHSVVSSAAALVLTQYFGENQSFVDDTETAFGLPIRKFQSFQQAAREASLSRLYGGIHFRDAIDQGIWLGEQVGKKVITKLQPHF